MVVGGWLSRLAARRPHVMLAVAPGATAARLAVESALADAGALVASSAADADVLVVVGEPGRELSGAVDEVWRELPGPRARAQVVAPAEARAAIMRAVAQLSDLGQVAEAAARRDEWRDGQTGNGMSSDDAVCHASDEDSGHGEHDSGDGGGARAGDADGDHHAHQMSHLQLGGAGHHGGDMAMPGGLMMAGRAADRDGLRLDALQVTLGPVLADWPAGLVITATVQGDVVQAADARVLDAVGQPSFWNAGDVDRRHAAAHLDSLGRLLAVVGWPAMAYRVRRLRDGALGEEPAEMVRAGLAAVDRRMRRSWTLRSSTDGLGVLTPGMVRDLGVTGPAVSAVDSGGDATARWQHWLAETDALLAGRIPAEGSGPRGLGGRAASAALLAAASQLMVGLDIGGARIVLASFDPDPDEVVPVPAPRTVA
jgi:hypothetical protein